MFLKSVSLNINTSIKSRVFQFVVNDDNYPEYADDENELCNNQLLLFMRWSAFYDCNKPRINSKHGKLFSKPETSS